MGIELGSNFDVKTSLPLDSRLKVADLTARDAIVSGVRYEGMIVYVVSEATNFQLVGGITNGDWKKLSGSGGGGGGSIKWRIETNGPLAGVRYFQEVFDFMAGEDQSLYMTMKLPSEYASGTPIKLKGSMVSVDTDSVDLLLLADISYTRPPTAMTSVDATRTSTNTAVAHTMSEVEVAQEFEIDVTDGDGEIDGDLLQAGDILLIKLYRDDGTLGDTSTLDLTFLPETTEVIFE